MSVDPDAQLVAMGTRLLEGVVSCEIAGTELDVLVDAVSPRLHELVHFLYHFIADEDIRSRDDGYAAIQTGTLRRLLAEGPAVAK